MYFVRRKSKKNDNNITFLRLLFNCHIYTDFKAFYIFANYLKIFLKLIFMAIRNLFVIVVVAIFAIGCSNVSESDKGNESDVYVAVIDSNMTLFEIAKANNIGEPYLRTKLGIPKKIGSKYDIVTMSKRFKFSIDDLRKIIEDEKNDVEKHMNSTTVKH